MRLSCCAYSYRTALQSGTLSLLDFLTLCRTLGCDGAELTAYYFPSLDRAYLNEVKRYAHKEGIAISGTAVGSDFAQPDSAKRAEHVAMTLAWIDHSVVLGAPTLRVFAGGVRQGQTEEEAFHNVVPCLQECAEQAYAKGVTLALENHGGLTATAEGTLNLLRAVDSPGLGLNLDFGNFSTDAYDQFAICAPYAIATHAKRSIHSPDPAERATVDYVRVRRIMDAVEYRGFLAIEYEDAAPAEEAVPPFVALLRNALS